MISETRRVFKLGGSLVISLPFYFAKSNNLKKGARVITFTGENFVLICKKNPKDKKRIAQLLREVAKCL